MSRYQQIEALLLHPDPAVNAQGAEVARTLYAGDPWLMALTEVLGLDTRLDAFDLPPYGPNNTGRLIGRFNFGDREHGYQLRCKRLEVNSNPWTAWAGFWVSQTPVGWIVPVPGDIPADDDWLYEAQRVVRRGLARWQMDRALFAVAQEVA